MAGRQETTCCYQVRIFFDIRAFGWPAETSFSGDGTLSVIDVRARTTEPFAQSEDQEDELLSIVPIKG